jgi:hypothetical protein
MGKLRETFAALVTESNPKLGKIAVDIARAVDQPAGTQACFLSQRKALWKQPANFLAKSETA